MLSEFMKNLLSYLILSSISTTSLHSLILPLVACFACKLPLGLAGAESGRGIFTFAIDVCYCPYCYSQYYDLVLQPPNDLLLLLSTPTYSYHSGQAPSPAPPP